MFFVGQKVVCIEADWKDPIAYLVPNLPREDAVYHVRAIGVPAYVGRQYILLAEIANPSFDGRSEPYFAADRFRPVIERKTDVSIFTEMLTPSKRERKLTDA